MEVIGIIVVLGLMFFFFCLGYRNRFRLGRWLNDSSCSYSIDPNARRKRLVRMIEDAKDEIARLDEEEG